jgi:hypothetical protein
MNVLILDEETIETPILTTLSADIYSPNLHKELNSRNYSQNKEEYTAMSIR